MVEHVAIENFTDDRNRVFVNELKKTVQISLQKVLTPMPDGRVQLWGCRPNPPEAIVYFYEDCQTSGFFTHELLHVDLILQGFTNFLEVQYFVSESTLRQYLFQEIFGHIMNIFGHVKFYDRFLDMGYRPDEFVGDYYIPLDLDNIRREIDSNFEERVTPNYSICTYIATYFSARDCHNPLKQDSYNRFLNELNQKDENLYKILDDHWAKWILSTRLNNLEIFSSMVIEIEQWHRNR